MKTPIVFPLEIFWPFTQVDPIIGAERLGSESQDGGNSVIDDSNNKISIDLENDSNQVAPFCAESEIQMPSDENEESDLTLVPSRYATALLNYGWLINIIDLMEYFGQYICLFVCLFCYYPKHI